MKRAEARFVEEHRAKEQTMKERFASTVVIGACIIAAVRLARDADIIKRSPRVLSVIADSVGLARMILEQVVR